VAHYVGAKGARTWCGIPAIWMLVSGQFDDIDVEALETTPDEQRARSTRSAPAGRAPSQLASGGICPIRSPNGLHLDRTSQAPQDMRLYQGIAGDLMVQLITGNTASKHGRVPATLFCAEFYCNRRTNAMSNDGPP
jgi:hypothetical protein